MTRRILAALLVAASLAGCGVSTEDEPRRIDGTLVRRPPATPTVSTRPVTTTTTTVPPTTSPANN